MTPIEYLAKITQHVLVRILAEPSYDFSPPDVQTVAIQDLQALADEATEQGNALVVQSVLPHEMCVLMLDFKTPHLDEGELVRLLSQNKLEGALFRTNNSYHFYGNKMLSHEVYYREILQLVGVTINDQPILDLKHVSISAKRRMAGLRVNAAWGKRVPKFVTNLPTLSGFKW
jgi:hypothetical protein